MTVSTFSPTATQHTSILPSEHPLAADDAQLDNAITQRMAQPDNPLLTMQLDSNSGKLLQKKLLRLVRQASKDFNMLQDGDKVMVCLSGGKDSYTLLDMMLFLKEIVPFKIDVVAVNLDQKQPGYPEDILPAYLQTRGVEYYILEKDTYSIVKRLTPEGKTYCAVCSRLRRGSLYGFASEIGATKVALGHHRDDIMATFFLNLFHGGAVRAMPAKLKSDDGQHILIRPLAYVQEKDIIKYAQQRGFPIIPCNLCGSQENLQRAQINDMLRQWDSEHPKRLSSIFGAISNIKPEMMLDSALFDFAGLQAAPSANKSNEHSDSERIPLINTLI